MRWVATVALLLAISACSAQVGYRVEKLPNGGRPWTTVPFPEISDWSTLNISLSRSACYGTCPSYKVEVHGDGTVLYDGDYHVAIPGKHRGSIAPETVRELYDAFKKAQFFWLFDEYTAPITDHSSYRLSISFDGRHKAVIDYVGPEVGMPREAHALEGLIDMAAGTEKWVKGNGETVASLKSEGWDFRSTAADHLKLLSGAAQAGNESLVHGLLLEGVPADNLYGCRGVERAADDRNVNIVRMLLEAGAPTYNDPVQTVIENPKTPSEREQNRAYYESICEALLGASRGGNPEILALILERHPDVNRAAPFRDGRTALMEAAQQANNDWAREHGADYTKIADLLIAAGADVNRQEGDGDTALMLTRDVAFARRLLQAGVKDINQRNAVGETALMQQYHPETVSLLLEAGADPYLTDNRGKTSLDHAQNFCGSDNKLCDVLKGWLRKHPK
jgi:ankyrin repeat protein